MEEKLDTEDKIIAHVCYKYRITANALFSRKRNKDFIKARHTAFSLLKYHLGYSSSKIGRLFKLNHTSVIHGLKNAIKKGWFDINNEESMVLIDQTKSVPHLRQESKSRWKRIYEVFGGACMLCGFDDAVEIHHVIPIRLGGTDNLDNLIVLCPNHHALLHAGLVDIKKIYPRLFHKNQVH